MTSRNSARLEIQHDRAAGDACTAGALRKCPPRLLALHDARPCPCRFATRSSVGLVARAAASARAGESAPVFLGRGRGSGGGRFVAHAASASGIAQTRIPRVKGMEVIVVFAAPRMNGRDYPKGIGYRGGMADVRPSFARLRGALFNQFAWGRAPERRHRAPRAGDWRARRRHPPRRRGLRARGRPRRHRHRRARHGRAG